MSMDDDFTLDPSSLRVPSARTVLDEPAAPPPAGYETEADYEKACTEINEYDLNHEYTTMAAAVSYWNARYTHAYKEAAHAKREYDEAMAIARLRLRAEQDGKPKSERLTVADIDAAVLVDEEVQDAHIIYIERESEKLRIKGIVGAVSTKQDMLRSLGAKLRIEMQGDPTVRREQAGLTFGDDD